jgi:hypothetical protein
MNRILAIWYVYFRLQLELRPVRDFTLGVRPRGCRTVLTRQCGIGPTGEACRIDDGPEVPCTGHNQACEDMKAEIKWVPSMENHDALPYVLFSTFRTGSVSASYGSGLECKARRGADQTGTSTVWTSMGTGGVAGLESY